jgi:pantothenate kinase
MFQDRGLILVKQDEMECLIKGLGFLVSQVPFEAFQYSEKLNMCFDDSLIEPFPCMLVNIGSGVSILKITGNFISVDS